MPVPNNPVLSALKIVDEVFAANSSNPAWHLEVERRFENILSDAGRNTIPSLEAIKREGLVDGQMVRFQGMIQDMYDPEYFYDSYEVTGADGRKVIKTGRFRDVMHECLDASLSNSSSRTMDRMAYYCVSTPAESTWAKQHARLPYLKTESLNAKSSVASASSEPASSSTKRPLESEDDVTMEESQTDDAAKRLRPEEQPVGATENPASQIDRKKLLNFPLPNEDGTGCIVKIYDDSDQFSINDIVEFVGIISIDPSLALLPSSDDLVTDEPMSKEVNVFEEEQAARNPSPSLIPRLHVISSKKIRHSNPLLPGKLSVAEHPTVFQDFSSSAKNLRSDLKSLLTELFLGDSLAAEYLICHLISSVYMRRDVIALGKFCINLTNIPTDCPSFVPGVTRVVEHLVAKSHYLPLSLGNLNGLPFVPRKDYGMNRLVSGVLQLSENTHLIVDETAMSAGTLDANGVKNIAALGNLISWQRVAYDFHYHQLEYNANIPVLILSEGKSLLPSDALVSLRPAEGKVKDFDNMLNAIFTFMSEDLSNRLRNYITVCKLMEYNLTDDIQNMIQQDFVSSRQGEGSGQSMSADDLHTTLGLARLLSISYGESTLRKEIWDLAKTLENERKERLAPSHR